MSSSRYLGRDLHRRLDGEQISSASKYLGECVTLAALTCRWTPEQRDKWKAGDDAPEPVASSSRLTVQQPTESSASDDDVDLEAALKRKERKDERQNGEKAKSAAASTSQKHNKKGKQPAVVEVESSESDRRPKKASRKGKERSRKRLDSDDSDSDRPAPRKRKRAKGSRVDPDEDAIEAVTEDEDAADIELDEPERFATQSRLRETKTSAWQTHLRKLQKQRRAQTFGAQEDSTSSESESSSESEDDRRRGPAARGRGRGRGGMRGGRSGRDENWKMVPKDDLDDFIASDDEEIVGGPVPMRFNALPEEFSLKRETPEYKFKVVFQYLIVLVIKGSGILPLKGDNEKYFGRQLRDVRNKMLSLRNSIAGVLWKPEMKRVMQKYPDWHVSDCIACIFD